MGTGVKLLLRAKYPSMEGVVATPQHLGSERVGAVESASLHLPRAQRVCAAIALDGLA